MNIVDAAEHARCVLTTFDLKCALNDAPRKIQQDFTEYFLIFMSQQSKSVPLGAIIGAITCGNQKLIPSATAFLEAVVDSGLVKAQQVNGNWVIPPIVIEAEWSKWYGINAEPMTVEKPFCGNILHSPKCTRKDHLEYMQEIPFKLNEQFLKAFPEIPEKVPFKKTLPGILESLQKDNQIFHLEHRFDTRGRTYCASHINYQGTQWEKCLIRLASTRKVNLAGEINLKEHISNLKEKENLLRWNAEQALEARKQGVGTGIMIGADASASGIQLMSVLRGCLVSAESVGLTNAGNDFYELAEKHSQLTLAEGMDARKVFKECSMQHFYGGTKTPKENLGEENLPKFYETLETLAPGCQKLLNELQATYWETPVFKWTLPDGFLVQQPVIETQRVEITMPNHPNVKFGYAYKSLVTKGMGLEMAANVVHSVDGYVARELIYRASMGNTAFTRENFDLTPALEKAYAIADPERNRGKCFSLRTLMETPKSSWALLGKQFLDKALVYAQAVQSMPVFEVVSVHDDFKCHPNFLHWVKFLYVEILADIAESTLIKSIIEEINPTLKYRKEPNYELAIAIREAFHNGTGKGLK
jgi:hypothetical protein